MTDVWQDFKEVEIKADTWEDITAKIKMNIKKDEWIRAVTQGLQDCIPMGNCPYYGKIPTHVLIKCRKEKENVGKYSKRGRNNLCCKQECIQCKTGEQNIIIITGNGSTTRNYKNEKCLPMDCSRYGKSRN